jgi:hypothetical protein
MMTTQENPGAFNRLRDAKRRFWSSVCIGGPHFQVAAM